MCGRRAAVLALLATLPMRAALADDAADLAALRQQIKALNERVNVLQQRMQDETRAAPAAPAPAEGKGPGILAKWRQVKPGMTEADVLALLGQPSAKFRAGGQTAWYYRYPRHGAGSVMFHDDGHAASSQSPPPGSGWW